MAKMKRLLSKAAFEALSDVLKEYYAPSKTNPEEYVLEEEDTDYKGKIDEFRDNNRRLSRELEDAKKRLEQLKDIDPEQYKKFKDQLAKLDEMEDADLIKAGKIDDLVQKRLQTARLEMDRQVKAKDDALRQTAEERDTLKNRLGVLLIDQSVEAALAKVARVRSGATEDVRLRARRTWSIDSDGKPVAKDHNGEAIFGKNGSPIDINEWAEKLVQDAPHLFESSQGGGGGGSKKGDGLDGAKVIPSGDPVAFGKNLKNIAAGKVKVAGSE